MGYTDFKKAYSYLNKYNLKNLWGISSALSLLEFYSNDKALKHQLSPVVNPVKLNLFTKAIIHSKSRNYKEPNVDSSTLIKVFNQLGEALPKPDDIENWNIKTKEDLHDTLMSLFVSQQWFQRLEINERAGILYELYHNLPEENEEYLKEQHHNRYAHIPESIEDDLGIKLENYICIGFALFLFYQTKHKQLCKTSPRIRQELKSAINSKYLSKKKRGKFFSSFVNKNTERTSKFYFTIDELSSQFEFIEILDKTDFKNFLNLLSTTPKEIGKIRFKKRFNKGQISQSLNPLEERPIIRIDNEYIIPDIRIFMIALTSILTYEISKLYDDFRFREVYGSIQELYIKKVLSKGLGNATLIPEQTYQRNGTEFKGPDLTILENDQLILLESKAKRTKLDSRVYGRSEFVLSDLERPIRAVKKLKEKKLEDLYKGLPQYSDWQTKLDATKDSEPIFVCVMEEAIMGLQEFVTNEAKRNPNFALSDFGYKYCFMDVFTFTTAVEIVSQNKDLLLSDVLKNYYMKAKRLDSNEGTSDMFDNYDIDYEKSFANQKFVGLINKLQND